jgi:hypothetical protein
MAVRSKDFYKEIEDELELVAKGLLNTEAIDTPVVANIVSNLEKQKANLVAMQTKLTQQLKEVGEKIAKLDAQIGQKKAP